MRTNIDKTRTAANSILLVRAKGYNKSWVKMEGYAADNAFDFGQGAIGETVIGVDGVQSGGFTPYEVDLNIQLQANSPSRSFFDGVINHINNNQETVPFEFSCEIPSIGKRYSATGFLVNIPGGTNAKKLLESATYSFKVVNNGAEDI
ncbi:hypothetical protein DNAOFDDG_02009 [Mannheimia haemolytica]|uniref:phage tail fiber protein n=1 Tax=Mannheimia haemolytica TaxID=75985 RepID=UPI0031F5BFC3